MIIIMGSKIIKGGWEISYWLIVIVIVGRIRKGIIIRKAIITIINISNQ